MAFIPVLSLVTDYMQVMEILGSDSNIVGNIIAEAVSIMVGLASFFFFIE